MSKIRKLYTVRLIGRCIIFVLCARMWLMDSAHLSPVNGGGFFAEFTVLHLLWGMWMLDMLYQIVPIKAKISLGSQKLFRFRFQPVREKINVSALKQYIVSTTRSAYLVMVLWILLAAAIGWLSYIGFLGSAELFMITVCFYVCDLICVLIWCPFRLMMRTRCCTTCRIFNWDHLMMFTPMIFVKGFYAKSLLVMSILVWIAWEVCVLIHPERFWEFSNEALKCSNCTDKLCTQYCQKLRR